MFQQALVQASCSMQSVFGAFAKTGYDGPLTLEVVYNDDSTLDSYMKHCFDCVCMIEKIMD